MLTRRLVALGFLVAVELSAVVAHAVPPLPCIAATLSANGRILVLNELTFDDPDETHPRTARRSTFRVYSRFSAANQGLYMNGPDSCWTHPMWSIAFENDGRPVAICSYTLVTDDGEFLVLFGGFFGSVALTIYRRPDHPGQSFGGPGPSNGVLVRKIPLSDLWPAERIQHFVGDEAVARRRPRR